MKLALAAVAVLALSGCVTGPKIDYCARAELRREAYRSAILAADVYTASGREVPRAVLLGRQAAVTALAVLNTNCP